MSRQTVKRPDSLADEIRRQLGSPGLKRYLASLPTFAVESGVPDRLRDLLADLKRAEARGRKSGGRPA